MAVHIARGLSPFQKETIVAIGDFGETGLWVRSPLVNWIALGSMMQAKDAPSLLERVPGQPEMTRLTSFGQKVRAFLKTNKA